MGRALFGLMADGDGGVLDVMRGHARPVNLPADATIVRASYDGVTDRVIFLIESAEYPPVISHAALPWADILFEKVR